MRATGLILCIAALAVLDPAAGPHRSVPLEQLGLLCGIAGLGALTLRWERRARGRCALDPGRGTAAPASL